MDELPTVYDCISGKRDIYNRNTGAMFCCSVQLEMSVPVSLSPMFECRTACLLTVEFPLAELVSLEIHLQDVAERGHVDEGELPHLLHVLGRQVPDPRHPQPALRRDQLLEGERRGQQSSGLS